MARRVTFDGLATIIRQKTESFQDDALDIVTEFADTGAAEMVDTLNNATTPTGEARAAAGGNGPGRVKTGQMRDDVTREAGRDGDAFTGKFGWIDDAEDYYTYQEDGTRRFRGMNALHSSAIRNREQAIARIKAAVRGENE